MCNIVCKSKSLVHMHMSLVSTIALTFICQSLDRTGSRELWKEIYLRTLEQTSSKQNLNGPVLNYFGTD